MRVAIISDTHGNALALDAVLADIDKQRVDQIVCLGDMIQGGPQPTELVDRLRALGAPVVMGNADDYMLNGKADDGEPITQQQEDTRHWQLSLLNEEDKAFIAAFEPTVEIELEGGKALLCFHGSPDSFNDIIVPLTPYEDLERMLGPYRDKFLTGGHTHTQQVRRLGANFFFNPGSVGLAYSHNQPDEGFQADPWADYAILTSEGDRIGLEFRRVPFDVQELIGILFSSGRPHPEAQAKLYGWTG